MCVPRRARVPRIRVRQHAAPGARRDHPAIRIRMRLVRRRARVAAGSSIERAPSALLHMSKPNELRTRLWDRGRARLRPRAGSVRLADGGRRCAERARDLRLRLVRREHGLPRLLRREEARGRVVVPARLVARRVLAHRRLRVRVRVPARPRSGRAARRHAERRLRRRRPRRAWCMSLCDAGRSGAMRGAR